MIEQVYFEHGGEWFGPFAPRWEPDRWSGLAPDAHDRQASAVRLGVLWTDGQTAADQESRLLRAEILGDFRDMPGMVNPTTIAPTRAFVPGLLNHGRRVALVGPKGVGKTTIVAQLAAAVVVPGRRFLNAFEPAQFAAEDERRDVWLINSEHPMDDLHAELRTAGLSLAGSGKLPGRFFWYDADHPQGRRLYVEHLAPIGGARAFDLSREDRQLFWEYRFVRWAGRNDPPLLVLADGVTAMLGSDTTGYGGWTAGMIRLSERAGIPSVIANLHTPLQGDLPMNGVESFAQWDGLWHYSTSQRPVVPSSRRYFWTTSPRGRDRATERFEVVMGEDGMLSKGSDAPAPTEAQTAAADSEARRERMRDLLRNAGKEGVRKTMVTGDSDEGVSNRRELDAMEKSGEVVYRSEQVGRARSVRVWLSEFAPS